MQADVLQAQIKPDAKRCDAFKCGACSKTKCHGLSDQEQLYEKRTRLHSGKKDTRAATLGQAEERLGGKERPILGRGCCHDLATFVPPALT